MPEPVSQTAALALKSDRPLVLLALTCVQNVIRVLFIGRKPGFDPLYVRLAVAA